MIQTCQKYFCNFFKHSLYLSLCHNSSLKFNSLSHNNNNSNNNNNNKRSNNITLLCPKFLFTPHCYNHKIVLCAQNYIHTFTKSKSRFSALKRSVHIQKYCKLHINISQVLKDISPSTPPHPHRSCIPFLVH